MAIAFHTSPEFERDLMALVQQHLAAGTLTAEPDTTWTVERAIDLLHELPLNALKFVRRVADDEHGRAAAEELRATFGDLKGPTGSLTKAITRGARKGRWPLAMPVPIIADYGTERLSWRKAEAYTMARNLLPVFREAFAHYEAEPAPAVSAEITVGCTDPDTTERRPRRSPVPGT